MEARTPMSPDERYDQTAIALAATRRNRPRHLVGVGAAALALAGLVLLGAWNSRRAAAGDLAREQSELATIAQLEAELNELRAAAAATPDSARIFETPPRILSQFVELAAEAGMTDSPPIPRQRSINVDGGTRVEWPYTVTTPTLQTPLNWVRLCMERIPGTFVSGLKVRPAGQQWQVEVVFARYERSP